MKEVEITVQVFNTLDEIVGFSPVVINCDLDLIKI